MFSHLKLSTFVKSSKGLTLIVISSGNLYEYVLCSSIHSHCYRILVVPKKNILIACLMSSSKLNNTFAQAS